MSPQKIPVKIRNRYTGDLNLESISYPHPDGNDGYGYQHLASGDTAYIESYVGEGFEGSGNAVYSLETFDGTIVKFNCHWMTPVDGDISCSVDWDRQHKGQGIETVGKVLTDEESGSPCIEFSVYRTL